MNRKYRFGLVLVGAFLLLFIIFKMTKRNTEKDGEIKLDVVVEDRVIKHIEILNHSETPGIDKAMVLLIDDIVAKNTLDVDFISGATSTSRKFIAAVKREVEKQGIKISDLRTSFQDENYKAEIEKIERDVIVIGGGGAGFAASIEILSTSDLSLLILEKMSFGGGNTRMSGGEYAAPGNWVQESEGIKNDSKEKFYSDIYKGGNQLGKPELIRKIVDNSLENAYWLRDFVGVEYKNSQSWYGGHEVARTLWPVGDGAQYIDTLIGKAEELGGEIKYNSRAVEFLLENGRVVGVRALSGGKLTDYMAREGVILASGGFGANVNMRMEYDTEWNNLDENIPTTNSPAIVGDGIDMAKSIGANLVGMEYIQLYPVNNPATGNYYFLDYARINSNALLLNQEGERFIDEKETRQNLSKHMLKQTGAKAYELIDSRVASKMRLEELYGNELSKCYEQGVLFKGSLEECSEFFKLPVDEVRKTLKRYNSFVESGKDLDFGRVEELEKIEEGPYFMFSCVVSVHHTMGGVEIDEKARVIDKDGKIVEGLYAAGEVTGGIHGGNRLGSLSIPDTVTFGRIAGKTILNKGQ